MRAHRIAVCALLFAPAPGDADDAGDELSELDGYVADELQDQILDEDPPFVWATAQRLLTEGRDARTVRNDLICLLYTSDAADE